MSHVGHWNKQNNSLLSLMLARFISTIKQTLNMDLPIFFFLFQSHWSRASEFSCHMHYQKALWTQIMTVFCPGLAAVAAAGSQSSQLSGRCDTKPFQTSRLPPPNPFITLALENKLHPSPFNPFSQVTQLYQCLCSLIKTTLVKFLWLQFSCQILMVFFWSFAGLRIMN